MALSSPVGTIVEGIRTTLEETPPELIADLMEHGIALAGGGALLKGIAERLSDETKMHVYVADDAMTCVVRGGGMVLEEMDTLSHVLTTTQRRNTRR